MSNKKNIVVPIDFSEQSLIALSQSYNLAKLTGAEITILHVIEQMGPVARYFSKEVDGDHIRKTIEKKMHQLAEETEKKTGIKVNSLVAAKGTAYDKINEVAEMLDAEFIIMGTHGAENLKKRFIGSNASRVIREATCPVITIKGDHHRDGCHNIVVPLDLTKETKEKISFALHLASLYKDVTLRLVSILQTDDEFIVNKLTRNINQVKEFVEQHHVKVTAEMIKGKPGEIRLADQILDYAKKVDADLIMIMTQQEQDWSKLFIGSSAQHIITHSEIPVCSIIPSMKKDMTVFMPY